MALDQQSRPHCTRCGRYLDKQPSNAYGWCETCQMYAQMNWPQPQPNPWPVVVPIPLPWSQPWTPPIVWWQPTYLPTTVITTGTPLQMPSPVTCGTGYVHPSNACGATQEPLFLGAYSVGFPRFE